LEQVRELYDRQRFAEAEKLALRVLQFDPLNGDAEGWKQKALDPLPEPEPLWEQPAEVQPEEWELIDFMVERFGKEKYLFNWMGRALLLPLPSGVGIEQGFIRLAEEPDKVAAEWLAWAGKDKDRIDQSFAHGCDTVALGEDFAFNEGPFMSPNTFERVYMPWLAEVADQVHAHGTPLLWHSCGDNRPLLDMMIEAGVDCYQSIQHTLDIREIKEKWGDRLALWGGFSTHSVVGGQPEELREQVRYSIKWCAPGGGFILGASHSVCVGAKKENYAAVLDELGVTS
jgi:uroporphyrinogen decarboxylase